MCRQFLVQLQAELYQVPFKWEPEGQFLHWGEACVLCTPRAPSPSFKGFTLHSFDPRIWDRWSDRWSPSCCLVLQSMVPALVMKTLMLAVCWAHQALNIEGIVTGFRYKGYNWSWWFMPLKCRLQGLGLGQLCLYPVLRTWVANREAIA